MKQIILVIVLSTFFACQNDDKNSPINKKHANQATVTTKNSIEPTSNFLEFVTEIEGNGWISDTARINKVQLYGLAKIEVRTFKDRPFYDIPYAKTQFHYILDRESGKKSDNILSEVKQIWGYFYRQKDATSWIPDGMIEQWSFGDSTSAKLAFGELKKHGNNIFFNTTPFFHRVNNDIFVFHARAMAFSYDQKPLFEKFVDKTRSEI